MEQENNKKDFLQKTMKMFPKVNLLILIFQFHLFLDQILIILFSKVTMMFKNYKESTTTILMVKTKI